MTEINKCPWCKADKKHSESDEYNCESLVNFAGFPMQSQLCHENLTQKQALKNKNLTEDEQ